MSQGKLIIISAPSGAGKTTLVRHLLSATSNLAFSVSACSRQKRPHEVNGRDYYFISEDEFRQKIMNDEFVEWEEVYPGHFYGTLKSEIERIWSSGRHVLFDVDVVGGLNIKRQYGNKAISIFIKPPSIDELERRLILRSTETAENLSKRIEKAENEMTFAGQFDLVIVNDILEEAKSQTLSAVEQFITNQQNKNGRS